MDGGLPCRAPSQAVTPTRAVDDLVLERCGPGLGAPAAIEPTATRLLLVIPEMGSVKIVAEGLAADVAAGAAVLLARPGAATAVWGLCSRGFVLRIPRRRLQAEASRLSGEPRRVAAVNMAVELAPSGSSGLAPLLREIWAQAPHDVAAGRLSSSRVICAVIACLQTHSPSPWGVAQSVKRALAYIDDPAAGDVSAERLAAAAGVTERTLRANFREVLGRPLPAVVQAHRLQWAHERLASARDSRSIEAFAAAAGFRSPAAFTRAYRRAFGESPTVTRALGVRNALTP
jgi:AraC-like DNA-binding protein